jgi:hypothetical protein
MSYPMVAQRVRDGELFLHGWYYVIEDGRVLVFDTEAGAFVPHELHSNARAAPVAATGGSVTEIDASHWMRFLKSDV